MQITAFREQEVISQPEGSSVILYAEGLKVQYIIRHGKDDQV